MGIFNTQTWTGNILNKKCVYTKSSTSSSSDERAPPLPKRRTQLTVLHYLYQLVHSNKSLLIFILLSLLLLLHLQPLLLFRIQKAPTGSSVTPAESPLSKVAYSISTISILLVSYKCKILISQHLCCFWSAWYGRYGTECYLHYFWCDSDYG